MKTSLLNPVLWALLVAGPAAPVLADSPPPPGPDSRYNVLFIIPDDLNRRIGPLGDIDAITPNLNRLAARSVVYRNCLCQYSLCHPSRASFLTGVYPWNLGVHQGGNNAAGAEETIPTREWLSEHFRGQGYWAGSYGKVEHNANLPKWDEVIPRTAGNLGNLLYSKSWGDVKGISGDSTLEIYDGDPAQFTDGVTATGTINAMASCLEDGRRFFIACGFYKPHTPWIVPQVISDLYDENNLQLPADPPGSYSNTHWPSSAYAKGKSTDRRPLMPEADYREMLKAYYSAVTLMDYNLGRVLDYLDTNSLWDNTVVVFASDNGFSLMEHVHLYSKRNYARESLNVPMMIHHPGMTTGGRFCDRQVGLIDLFPTILDLAGVDPYPLPIDGQSLAPLQENPTATWTKPALSSLSYPSHSIPRFRISQIGPWKLVEGPFAATKRRVMNHTIDPLESYPVTPNASLGIPHGLDSATLSSLEAAVAEIPFRSGVYYTFKPTNPDRDGDGVSDQLELDLAPLGFHPFLANTGWMESLFIDGLDLKTTRMNQILTLEGLDCDPALFEAHHEYPITVRRADYRGNYKTLNLSPVLSPTNKLQWIDNTGDRPKQAFYKLLLGE